MNIDFDKLISKYWDRRDKKYSISCVTPPTERQLRYMEYLKIEYKAGMTKDIARDAIARVVRALNVAEQRKIRKYRDKKKRENSKITLNNGKSYKDTQVLKSLDGNS